MSNFLTVLKKELVDIFRDKKTLLLTLILPILIYPIMFKFMSSSMQDMVSNTEKEINIYYEGAKNSSVENILKSLDNINFVDSFDAEKDLKAGDLQLIIKVPASFDSNISTGSIDKIEILTDEESNTSMLASSFVKTVLDSYKDQLISNRLAENGLDNSILNPFQIEVKSGISQDGSEDSGAASMLMSMIPTLIVILMVSSTVGMAVDLGAGEKEKFTFEPLLSTATKRSSLLWGKVIALCVVSAISLIANLTAMVFSMKKFMLGSLGEGEISFKMDLYSVLGILIVGILILVTLSSLQIAISIYARSTKEANSYLAGVTMPVMILAFIPYMTDAKSISPGFFHIPITNSICLMKEFLVGIYDIKHILIILVWHLLYITLSVLFAKFMFNREEVIFRN